MAQRLLAVAASVLVALTLAAPAHARDPIMPLRDVRPGMQCTGLSVVRGTAISSFRVEVVDVIVGGSEQSGPRILVRVSGPAVAGTGIGPGFSGSPILCRDAQGVRRNIGAISEGVGDFGNFVALATPIEEILSEPAVPVGSTARRDPALLRSARPLVGPITVGGLSGAPRRMLARAARRANVSLLAVPAGPLGGYPVQTLRPGSSVAASIADGDVSLGAVGTVAFRDGRSVWVFGHSLDSAGPRSLFLQDAYVFSVINNPLGVPDLGAGTYKLATAGGHTVGTVTNDADAAVVGQVGSPPASVALETSARDLDTGGRAFTSSRLADERPLGLGSGASLVAPLALAQSSGQLLRSARPATLRMCARFKIREREKRFGFCNVYFSLDEALTDLAAASDLVDSYDLTPLGWTGLSARLKVRRGVKEDVLLGARAPAVVRPGERIRVRLRLRRRRGEARRIVVPVRIPRSLSRGERTLVLEGSGGFDDEGFFEIELESDLVELFAEEDLGSGGDEPGSVAELIRSVQSFKRKLGITARFRRRGPEQIVLKSNEVKFSGRVRVPLTVVRRRSR